MRSEPQRSVTRISRRHAIRVFAAASVGSTVAGTAACSRPLELADSPVAMALDSAAIAAREDALLVTELARVDVAAAPVLTLIADQRLEHAQALTDEMERVLQRPSAAVTRTGPTPSRPAPTTPSHADVREALARSARWAAHDAAATASGFSASLLGAVAAATRVHGEVLLG